MKTVSLENRKTNIYLEFCIMGEIFNPEDISKSLLITPSNTWNKGDPINSGVIQRGTRKYCNWAYKTDAIETLDVNTVIDIFQSNFSDKVNNLIELNNRYELTFSIDIVVDVEGKEVPSLCFEGFIVDFASTIGARIDVDMYIN